MIARHKVRKFPFIGEGMAMMQALWIKRASSKSRKNTLNAIKERCKLYIKDSEVYNPIVIPPEGCYTNGTALLKFKKGAFVPMVPIKIVCLKYISDKYNLNNIGVRRLFGSFLASLQLRR
jgi:1-acyl-sn-glycerol-3-phosphate acyltransferase